MLLKELIVDTNILLRFLLNDVPKQTEEAKLKFEQAKAGRIKLVVPQIVIFEIIFALTKIYRFEKNKVIDIVRVLINSDYLEVESRETLHAALDLFRLSKISFVDCFIVSYAKSRNAEVLTFDKDLNKLSKS